MNTYLIDFRRYDGTESFEIVMAANEYAATMVFEDLGIEEFEEILYVTELEREEEEDEI